MKAVCWLVLAGLLCACALPPAPPPASREAQAMKKINLDLSEIDSNGMIGPADGKRFVAYEFCIPRDEAKKSKWPASIHRFSFLHRLAESAAPTNNTYASARAARKSRCSNLPRSITLSASTLSTASDC